MGNTGRTVLRHRPRFMVLQTMVSFSKLWFELPAKQGLSEVRRRPKKVKKRKIKSERV